MTCFPIKRQGLTWKWPRNYLTPLCEPIKIPQTKKSLTCVSRQGLRQDNSVLTMLLSGCHRSDNETHPSAFSWKCCRPLKKSKKAKRKCHTARTLMTERNHLSIEKGPSFCSVSFAHIFKPRAGDHSPLNTACIQTTNTQFYRRKSLLLLFLCMQLLLQYQHSWLEGEDSRF